MSSTKRFIAGLARHLDQAFGKQIKIAHDGNRLAVHYTGHDTRIIYPHPIETADLTHAKIMQEADRFHKPHEKTILLRPEYDSQPAFGGFVTYFTALKYGVPKSISRKRKTQ